MSLKSIPSEKSLSIFVVLDELRSIGCKYLNKHHLKHSLSSIFLILIKPFLDWSNSFGSLM